MSESKTLHDAVLAVLESQEYKFIVPDGEPIARLNIQGDNGYWMCLAQSREEQRQILFYAICPANCRPERMGAMAELLTRINYRLAVGCFEMDFDTGQVRLRTAIGLGEAAPDTALIEQAFQANIVIMDAYLPVIMTVIIGPIEAMQSIPKPSTA